MPADRPDRADPLDVLAQPAPPLAPRAEFAAELRRRLEAALGRPSAPTASSTTSRGGAVTDTATTPAHLPAGHSTVTPYLCATGALDAIAYYRDVFGAVETSPAIVGDDGRLGHAEIAIGTSRVMISDEYPEMGVVSPTTLGGSPTMFNVYVPDAEATVALAAERGAEVVRPVERQPYGDLSGQIVDPWGHRWSVNTHVEDVDDDELARRFAEEGFTTEATPAAGGGAEHAVALVADEPGRRQGDVFYWTFGVRDAAHSRRFFAELFDWEVEDGHVPTGAHVASVTPPGGMFQVDAGDAPSKTLYFRVPDIQVAVAKVRELGGTASEPVLHDSGWDSTCTDGEGTEFNLSQPAPKYA